MSYTKIPVTEYSIKPDEESNVRRNSKQGFTLIELTMVAVILMIIAAIAIPNFLRSRLSAQESSAIATLRTIASAQAQVQSQGEFTEGTSGVGLYGSFLELSTLDPPPLDESITLPPNIKSGYQFSLDFSEQTEDQPYYTALAVPLTPGENPRHFFTDPSGVIRYTTDGSIPDLDSPSL